MKFGFDFLESILFKGVDRVDNRSLIKELPPIFRLFVENFQWNEEAKNCESLFFIPYLSGGEISVRGWNYREMFSKDFVYEDDFLEENGFVCIATSNRGIYLGTKGEHIDKIFSTRSSLDESLVLVANNMFEFVRGLTDNISCAADSEDEFRRYMVELGYEDDDLEEEVKSWIEWRKKQ